ncbi:MAG: hypothetical protein DRH12_01400 [Deltaproteobacteria bacterium]|nr:MAG: hypothetical protein DRH12_01400 [Deltaproteobacteria bacterium]
MNDFEQKDHGALGSDSVPYAPRNKWKAKVWREGDIIVKDYSSNPMIQKLYGRLCINWEAAALQRLSGLEGIPSFIERTGPYTLKMSAVPGIPISKMEKGTISEIYFQRLVKLFEQIHQRGVAHGDAHQRNILIHNDFPYLVDFSTAYVKGRFPVFDDYVFKCFVQLDLERLYKVEKKFFDRGTPPKMFMLYRVFKRSK